MKQCCSQTSCITPGYLVRGRRLADIRYLIANLKKRHRPFDCGIENMILIGERQVGMKSCFIFKCEMCNVISRVWSEDPNIENTMDVNTATVTGIITSGIGYTQWTELAGALNMPVYAPATYHKYLDEVNAAITDAAYKEMEEAAKEEFRLAVEAGDVSADGVPFITVISDGSWLTRSYKNNYKSLLGAAFIIGYRTGRILYAGARSKYCMICHRARIRGVDAKPHNCIKNWGVDQSSSSMEQDIIVQGFKQSMHEDTVHKMRYTKLIADGDSSVLKNLMEAIPYPGYNIEKIECRNHLYRNFCTKLKDIASTTTAGPLNLRKAIDNSVLRLRAMIANAVATRRAVDESITRQASKLRQDILHAPYHVFGDHSQCPQRCGDLCKGSKKGEKNLVPDLKKEGLWSKIPLCLRRLLHNCRSLIVNVDNSQAEMSNSIAAKLLGGKRILYSRSYFTRILTVVINVNTGGEVQRTLHKNMFNDISPGCHTKRLEMSRIKHNRPENKSDKPRRNLFHSDPENNPDYGSHNHTPPLVGDELTSACNEILELTKMNSDEIAEFERNSRQQALCEAWLECRRYMLTASLFGEVAKLCSSTLCDSIIKKKLYTDISSQDPIIYGRTHEIDALLALEEKLGIKIEQSGLFKDLEFYFLGGTPDGLYSDKTIIVVKCSYSAELLSPDDAIKQKAVTFWRVKKDGTIGEINTNHNWYYQIQGALHIARRNKCIFAIWTPVAPHLKVVTIERDDNFWETKIKNQVFTFYKECLLPELADPMRQRKLPIRNPQHRIDAHKAFLKRIAMNKKLREDKARKKNETPSLVP